MKIGHAASRRHWRSSFIDDPDAKLFSLLIQMQKKTELDPGGPWKVPPLRKSIIGGLRRFFLMISTSGLESYKTLSTLTTGPATIIHLKPYKHREPKRPCLYSTVRSRNSCPEHLSCGRF